MFQAPRPVSLAPSITAFTPSAPVQSPPYVFGGSSHASGGGHVAAVPIATSGHHRPLAVHRGGSYGGYGSGSSGGVGNRGPIPAAHFAQRMAPGYDPSAPTYSPQPSPISLSSSSGSSGVPSSSPATPAGAHDPRLLGIPGGSANGTPSPEPFFAFAHPQQVHHVDIYVPQSPMVSPMMSPHAMRIGDQPPAGGLPRRDSVDEVAQANAHLHNILWRNAGIQLQNAATLRHVPLHTMTATPGNVNDSAQPNRGTLSSPKPTMSAEAPGTPTTSERVLSASHPASPIVGSSTRAIPISRGTDPHKQLPRLQPSVLAQLQAAEENSTPGGSTHAAAVAASSREGSRRGSVSASNPNTATTNQGSFISSSSPMSSSLSTSFTVLSHTPPQRSDNPQDHDCCFSPAQQAAYFKQLQSHTTPNGSSEIPSLLPMMHSMPHSFGAHTQSSHSPTLRHSSLTYSLAQHRQTAAGGAPTAPGTPQRAMLSKFASSPIQGFAPSSTSVQATSYVPPAAAASASNSAPAQSDDPAAPTPSSYPG